MAYEKQEWVPRETIVSSERMEHIEEGIGAADALAAEAKTIAEAAAAATTDVEAAMTLAAGFSWRTGNAGRVRRIGNIVFAWGQFEVDDAWSNSGSRATMPPEFAPPMEVPVYYVTPGSSSGVIDAWISTSGDLRATGTSLRPAFLKFFTSYPAKIQEA